MCFNSDYKVFIKKIIPNYDWKDNRKNSCTSIMSVKRFLLWKTSPTNIEEISSIVVLFQ